MKQNTSLWFALRFLQFCFGLVVLLLIAFYWVMLAGLLDWPLEEKIILSGVGRPGAWLGMNYCMGETCSDSFDVLSYFANEMIIWLIVRQSVLFALNIMILWKAMDLIKSIRFSKTFYEENIRSFMQMAKYGLIMALISAINFRYDDQFHSGDSFSWVFDIPFSILLFTLACKVLAEIFKQGKLLSEENQSFV